MAHMMIHYSSNTYSCQEVLTSAVIKRSSHIFFLSLYCLVRFNCLKCGYTGEAEDASYRYRLSLKIADTNDLFDITVFGSCLDPFFGVTAENLKR